MAGRTTTGRPGRLPDADRDAREQAILDAALAELVDRGPAKLSMLGVAKRAGASKETLYSWFGDRDGLLTALIERNAEQTVSRVRAALDSPDDERSVLEAFATGLLRLLVGPSSVALNRAAMTSPDLAALVLRSGRHRVGPLVESYLESLDDDDRLAVPDAASAFELLYGLVIRDTQIRVLLGEPAPTAKAITRRAEEAIDQFLRLLTR